MRILLTGAAGFTGVYFAKAALAAGHEVCALQADLRHPLALKEEVLNLKPDAVVHLAAISFVGHENEAELYGVNVVGTINLLNALTALPQRPHRVLLASSANVYGNALQSPIDELQACAPVNHYAASKVAMEMMARNFASALPIVVTRPFNYTGPGQAANFIVPKLVRHFKQKAPLIELGNLHVEREFNDARMVCEAYLALLTRPLGQEEMPVFNICSGQMHTLQSLIDTLSALTGHHMAVNVNPAFVRPLEVHKLCGNPSKLIAVTGPLAPYTLHDTLSWMLERNA